MRKALLQHSPAGHGSKARSVSASSQEAVPEPLATRMYHLAPLAVGTSETESLTSYVRRLAAEHVVSPSALLRHEVLEPNRIGKMQQHNALTPVLSLESVNGPYRTTEILVRGLEQGTGIALRGTTMLDRDDAVCLDGAFRHVRAWCPECLQAPEPYDRLTWAFKDIKTCQSHGLLLVDRCGSGSCRRPHRSWHRAANPSLCPHCGAPLSSGGRTKATPDASESIVRDVLALLLTGTPLTRDAIAAGLVHLLRRSTWAAVSGSSGVSYATLCGIRRRSIRPQLDVLVNLVGSSGEDLTTFLTHPATKIITRRLPKPTKGPGPQGKKLAYTPPALQQALRDAITAPEGEIPSAKGFARTHKTTLDTLRRRWPQLTLELVLAFAAQEKMRRRRREAAEVALLADAVTEAQRQGDPRRRTVERLLGRASLFRQKHIQDAYARMVA